MLIEKKATDARAGMNGEGIDVYWDEACTQTCREIHWGVLTPGQKKKITVYVKNTGTLPITGSFNTSDWVPPLAANYISLTWNFGDKPLDSGKVRVTDFTLTVDPAIHDVTDFYFNITVTGTKATFIIPILFICGALYLLSRVGAK
jgi:hypothetical protein